jgi:hypothetical protein
MREYARCGFRSMTTGGAAPCKANDPTLPIAISLSEECQNQTHLPKQIQILGTRMPSPNDTGTRGRNAPVEIKAGRTRLISPGGANLPVDVVAVERGRRLGPNLVGSSPDSPLERSGFELVVPQFSSCCAGPAFLRRISVRLSKELDGFQRTPRFRQGYREIATA